ncbi:MAG: hypothetical protein K6C12_05380 [Oscillospiraceae bacterium]|nr:hypothetical protein [Oscillospiraceae bacterium]
MCLCYGDYIQEDVLADFCLIFFCQMNRIPSRQRLNTFIGCSPKPARVIKPVIIVKGGDARCKTVLIRFRDHLIGTVEDNIPVEKIFHIVKGVPVIEIIGKVAFSRSGPASNAYVVQRPDHRSDTRIPLESSGQIVADFTKRGAFKRGFDRMNIEKSIKFRRFKVLSHGGANDQSVIIKMLQNPIILTPFIIHHIKVTLCTGLPVMEKRISYEYGCAA